jgi:hypothetical protein
MITAIVGGFIASFLIERWGGFRGVTRIRTSRARTRYSAPTDAEPPRWASHQHQNTIQSQNFKTR